MKNLILEIGTEELPASVFAHDGQIYQLKSIAEEIFAKNNFHNLEMETFGTPRRMVLFIKNFPAAGEPTITEIKGPPAGAAFKDGKPTQAATGFAKSKGAKIDDIVIKKTEEGEYAYIIKKEEGKKTLNLLPKILPQIIESIKFTKSMRWMDSFRFIRPIRWILSLYGENKIEFSLAGIKSSNVTYGHRILNNSPVKVDKAYDYFSAILKVGVMVNGADREKVILEQSQAAAKQNKGKIDFANFRIQKTLQEVVNLVENPHPIVGSFAKEYLVLPRCVIETVFQSHQRYFPVEDGGELLPKFVVVHNGDPKHDDIIRQGHEKVVNARLADGKFYFEEDVKKNLSDRICELKGIVFQEKLGTVYDKTQRIKKLSLAIAKKLKFDEKDTADLKVAAPLIKADLVTEMVSEFGELQGSIGRVYAKIDGANDNVSSAIFEHYLPRFIGDGLPQTLIGKILSIADKIDTIVGCFAIGITPTSGGDPYALRRQGHGVVQIITENTLHLSTAWLIEKSYELIYGQVKDLKDINQVNNQVKEFLDTRINRLLLGQLIGYDIMNAILALNLDDLTDIKLRAHALTKLKNTKVFEDIITAFTRCKNLGNTELITKVDKSLLREKEEKDLYNSFTEMEGELAKHLRNFDYEGAIRALAKPKHAIDEFFDSILVMAKEVDIKTNRIALLNFYTSTCLQVADLSKIVMSEFKP